MRSITARFTRRARAATVGTPDLEAIDAATGNHKWTITAGNDGIYLQGTVATAGGLVFSGCGFKDTGGINYGAMCAYKRSNGDLAWQFSAPCNCQPESVMAAPLVYSGGTVYFGYGNGGGTCGGDTHYIVAADAKTGTVRWTYTTGDCNSLSSTAPVVADGHVYFEANDNLVALSQTDGSLLWSAALCSGYGPTGLTAAKGVVYANVVCNGTGSTAAFDGATGTQLWTVGIPGDQNFVVPPSLSKGVLYVTAGDHQIHALDAKTGATIWSGGPGTNSPASVANGVLYVDGGRDLGGARPSATAYNASDGTELWETPAPGSTLNPGPMVANGTVYITNAQCGTVCAYTVPLGKVR